MHLFDALDFLAELAQHIPPRRVQLIRRYGLCASRTKGRWSQMPHVAGRAPDLYLIRGMGQVRSDPVGQAHIQHETAWERSGQWILLSHGESATPRDCDLGARTATGFRQSSCSTMMRRPPTSRRGR